eukprot:SAG11_NODE_438_length_9463_cov_47.214957_6_plen_339_part_00
MYLAVECGKSNCARCDLSTGHLHNLTDTRFPGSCSSQHQIPSPLRRSPVFHSVIEWPCCGCSTQINTMEYKGYKLNIWSARECENASSHSPPRIPPTHRTHAHNRCNSGHLTFKPPLAQPFLQTCRDVGGQQTIRAYWRNYFETTEGLIWVVDRYASVLLRARNSPLCAHPSGGIEVVITLLGVSGVGHTAVPTRYGSTTAGESSTSERNLIGKIILFCCTICAWLTVICWHDLLPSPPLPRPPTHNAHATTLAVCHCRQAARRREAGGGKPFDLRQQTGALLIPATLAVASLHLACMCIFHSIDIFDTCYEVIQDVCRPLACRTSPARCPLPTSRLH